MGTSGRIRTNEAVAPSTPDRLPLRDTTPTARPQCLNFLATTSKRPSPEPTTIRSNRAATQAVSFTVPRSAVSAPSGPPPTTSLADCQQALSNGAKLWVHSYDDMITVGHRYDVAIVGDSPMERHHPGLGPTHQVLNVNQVERPAGRNVLLPGDSPLRDEVQMAATRPPV